MGLNIVGDVKAELNVGEETFFESHPENDNNYMVVFEDDGDAGYFYALDKSCEKKIQEALHIYNVEGVADKAIPSDLIIAWSKDGTKSILIINDQAHAVLDFENKNGYCRSGFPPRDEKSVWSPNGHDWNEGNYNDILYGKK